MRRILLALLLLIGCHSTPAGGQDEVRLRTDATVYFPGSTVTATVTNGLEDAVYIGHCDYRPQLVLERRESTGWQAAGSGLCLAIYPSGELRLAPRATITTTLEIQAEGEYRLVLYGRRAPDDFGDLAVRSPSFQVRFPPD